MPKRKYGRPGLNSRLAQFPIEFKAKISEAQYDLLDKSAGKLDLPMSAVVRQLIDEDLPRLVERERAKAQRQKKKGQASGSKK